MKVFKLRVDAQLPTKADGDMCYDLYASMAEPLMLSHNTVVKVPTGIAIDFGEYHASFRPRSGMATKGIDVLGGQIDSTYRGELIVLMTIHSKTPYTISPGDKIAQMKLEKDVTVEVVEVSSMDELSITNRGSSGFGSSGK